MMMMMKTANVMINFNNDTVDFGGKNVIKLICSSGANHCLPFTRCYLQSTPSNTGIKNLVLHATETHESQREKEEI